MLEQDDLQPKEPQTNITAKANSLILEPKYFDELWQYVENDDITDVDFNGTDLWLTDKENTRTKVENHGISPEFINNFSQRVANQVSKQFNKRNSLLEAETDTLRISVIHESVAVSGTSVCIRKSLPVVRMSPQSMVETKYCDRAIINLITNCILAKMNVVIGGEPGAGKTEAAKFFTQFIPDSQRVITIEDSPEWHYKEINPNHDCVELRINEDLSYANAIKTCLRQNPKWIMLSEARSVEVKYLIESFSTGVNGVTTIHTDDIRNIPSRVQNMMPNRDDADRIEYDIYNFVHLTFLVRRKEMEDGTSRRYIDQLGFLYVNNNKEKKIEMLIKNGEFIRDVLPHSIEFKLKRAGIEQPFECKAIDDILGDTYFYIPLPTDSKSKH